MIGVFPLGMVGSGIVGCSRSGFQLPQQPRDEAGMVPAVANFAVCLEPLTDSLVGQPFAGVGQ